MQQSQRAHPSGSANVPDWDAEEGGASTGTIITAICAFLGFSGPGAAVLAEITGPVADLLLGAIAAIIIAYTLARLVYNSIGILADQVRQMIDELTTQLPASLRKWAKDFLWFLYDPYNQLRH